MIEIKMRLKVNELRTDRGGFNDKMNINDILSEVVLNVMVLILPLKVGRLRRNLNLFLSRKMLYFDSLYYEPIRVYVNGSECMSYYE